MPAIRKARQKTLRTTKPAVPPKAVVKEKPAEATTSKTVPSTIPTGSLWGVSSYLTLNYDSIATTGGRAFGLSLFWGDAFADRANLWGLSANFELATLKSHLPELNGIEDSRKGISAFINRWDISKILKGSTPDTKSDWNSFSQDLRGLGISQFCPAVGDNCWSALHIDSLSSMWGLRYKDVSSGSKGFYAAATLNISTKTYLHLISDETQRNYSHPAREFGLNFALNLGYGDPSVGAAANETLNTIETWHEAIKYILDDAALFLSAKTAGDNLQKANRLLDDAGFGSSNTPGTNTQTTATTGISTLVFLNSLSAGRDKSKHLKLFDKMSSESRDLFFWGNTVNTAALLGSALAKNSNTLFQGALSSLQHTATLFPAWKKAETETQYWLRFAIPHLMAVAGLAANDPGKRQAFLHSATEGMMTESDVPVESKTYSYSLLQKTTESFANGELSGQRAELAVEKKLKSGWSTRTAIASPVFASGNTKALGENLGNNVGVVDGNGAAYESATLPATASSMVGWRGTFGDTFQLTASVFGGTAINLGPQTTPQLGVTGRASIGAGIGDITLLEKKWTFGAEVFASGSKFSDSSTTDTGVAATITIR